MQQAGKASHAAFTLRALQDRVESLRVSSLAAATDEAQLIALRDRYARLVDGARSVVVDLVGLWKRNCVTALGLLGASQPAAPKTMSAAANALRDAGNRLVTAIDTLANTRR